MVSKAILLKKIDLILRSTKKVKMGDNSDPPPSGIVEVFTKPQEGRGDTTKNDSEVSKNPENTSMQQDAVKDSVSAEPKESEASYVNQRRMDILLINDGISEVKKKKASPYGPWMPVKRQPRKKTDSSNKKTNSQVSVKPTPEVDNGSRFSLFQDEELEEDNQRIETGKSVVPQPKVIRVRDPKAGKNNQSTHSKSQSAKKQVNPKVNIVKNVVHPSHKPVTMEASSSKLMMGVQKKHEP
ncbi:putative arginine/serine-rich protein 1 [Sesbania bispinosa]|nr:putative arginine/serine-rich protein 1 [Sesbania bispinosa]